MKMIGEVSSPLAFASFLVALSILPRLLAEHLQVSQAELYAMLLENVVQRDPVHTRGLHGHRIDPARLEPFRHLVQGCRPAPEFPHRIRVPIRWHGHIVALVPHVNPSGIGMNDCQPGIGRRYLPLQHPPLFPVQTSTFQTLESGHPALCHGILLKSEFRPGLGSACEETTDSPTGLGRAFFKALGPPQSMPRGSPRPTVKTAP